MSVTVAKARTLEGKPWQEYVGTIATEMRLFLYYTFVLKGTVSPWPERPARFKRPSSAMGMWFGYWQRRPRETLQKKLSTFDEGVFSTLINIAAAGIWHVLQGTTPYARPLFANAPAQKVERPPQLDILPREKLLFDQVREVSPRWIGRHAPQLVQGRHLARGYDPTVAVIFEPTLFARAGTVTIKKCKKKGETQYEVTQEAKQDERRLMAKMVRSRCQSRHSGYQNYPLYYEHTYGAKPVAIVFWHMVTNIMFSYVPPEPAPVLKHLYGNVQTIHPLKSISREQKEKDEQEQLNLLSTLAPSAKLWFVPELPWADLVFQP